MKIEEEFLPDCAWCTDGLDLDDASPMCRLHRACYILIGVNNGMAERAHELKWLQRGAYPLGRQVLSDTDVVAYFERSYNSFRVAMNPNTPPPHL